MTAPSPSNHPRLRRRRRFVRPDIQLKVVFITLFVSCVTLVVQMRLSASSLREISSGLAEDLTAFQVLDLVETAVLRGLLLSVVIALPLALAAGVVYSFRFAGPIYKLHRYFSELSGGRWDRRCELRKDDDLQDVAESVNVALDEARDRVCEDQSILQDVRHLLTSSVFTTDESSGHLVTDLLDRIAGSEAAFAVRFPDADPSSTPPSDAEGRDAEAPVADRERSSEPDVPGATPAN